MKNRRLLLGILLSVMIIAVGCSQKLDLIGRGWLDGDWMQDTRCYRISNKLIKKYAKENGIVYCVVAQYDYPILLIFWYFNHLHNDTNRINIVTVNDDGIIKTYQSEYPYDLQWLWDIKHHDWPDSLLIVQHDDVRHPKDFQRIAGMPSPVISDEKAIVYDSKYINVYMPTYYLTEKFGEKLDSLSPIYRTYHESYEHFVYPIVDSLMTGKSERAIKRWKGVYAE